MLIKILHFFIKKQKLLCFKKISVMVLLIALFFQINIIKTQSPIFISPFSQTVHQRLYIISRLENYINMLEHLNQNSIIIDKEKPVDHLFKNEKINCCINEIYATNTIDSLLRLWQDIASYKHIEDIEFVEEFITMFSFITQSMTSHVNQLKVKNSFHRKNLLSIQELLDNIEDNIKFLYKTDYNNTKSTILHTQDSTTITSDPIFERFYYIKRLAKPITLLFIKKIIMLFFFFQIKHFLEQLFLITQFLLYIKK